jgi:delta-aminolevulinic acid dehydratase/porphobilinogen synthase
MTANTNLKDPGANAAGSAHAATAGAQGSTGNAGYTSQGFEGSMKQASDVNSEEALSVLQALNPKMAGIWADMVALNAKRTYDQAQSTDLSTQVGDSTQRMTLNNLATQALQNAVETANMVSKQAVRHSDIAIDRQWNLDEQGYQAVEVLRNNTFKDAIAGVVAAAVAEALSKK